MTAAPERPTAAQFEQVARLIEHYAGDNYQTAAALTRAVAKLVERDTENEKLAAVIWADINDEPLDAFRELIPVRRNTYLHAAAAARAELDAERANAEAERTPRRYSAPIDVPTGMLVRDRYGDFCIRLDRRANLLTVTADRRPVDISHAPFIEIVPEV